MLTSLIKSAYCKQIFVLNPIAERDPQLKTMSEGKKINRVLDKSPDFFGEIGCSRHYMDVCNWRHDKLTKL